MGFVSIKKAMKCGFLNNIAMASGVGGLSCVV